MKVHVHSQYRAVIVLTEDYSDRSTIVSNACPNYRDVFAVDPIRVGKVLSNSLVELFGIQLRGVGHGVAPRGV